PLFAAIGLFTAGSSAPHGDASCAAAPFPSWITMMADPVSGVPEEQRRIRAAIERLCAQFGDAYWLEHDRAGGFPEDFYKAVAAGGWLGIAMPEEYGGAGLGIAEAAT